MADWLNTESDLTPWETQGNSQERLSELVEKVYWEGLRREIASAILSLKKLDNKKTLQEEEEIMLRLPDRAAYFAAAWCKIISAVDSREADYGASPFQA
jgi:hypothetical protein